ncbi:MAG: hypothetical protein Q8P01_05380 [bacterium]|nr:hypothetical protein [bacterium]
MLDFDWGETFRRVGALWVYSGKPGERHVVCTSKLHAGEFFNARVVAENEELLREIVESLLESARHHLCNTGIDCVFGPETGARPFVEECARVLHTAWAMTQKNERELEITTETNKPIKPGALSLAFEDTVTTGGSIEKSIAAMEMNGAIVLPIVLAILNRSGGNFVGGRRIISLLHRPTKLYTRKQCLFCKGGSVAIEQPKNHWDLFMAT